MEKWSEDLAKNHNLVFYPKTDMEAEFIQKTLLALGFQWPGDSSKVMYIDKSVKCGLVSMNRENKIYTNPSLKYPYLEVDISTMPGYNPRTIQSHSEAVLKLIQEQGAEITELRQKLDRVLEILEPRRIEKPLKL